MTKDKTYQKDLVRLQIGLVRYQEWAIETGAKALVIFEGRDGAGKDGTIARITEHLAPRNTRVVSLPKPSDRQRSEWYFQRYVRHLPACGELVLFNRSWYNRAGVEKVMGYSTPAQVEQFFESVVPFETMLERDGIAIRKYYLDISRKEQKERLEARAEDPLKQWKLSPVDAQALWKWKSYTAARDEMLRRTSHPHAPWHIVKADVKKVARLELIRDLLASFVYEGKANKLARPDPAVVFEWSDEVAAQVAV